MLEKNRLLFFLDELQSLAKQELKQKNVQDFTLTIIVGKILIEYTQAFKTRLEQKIE